MKRSIKCPHCHKSFEAEIQLKEMNKFGFEMKSKGALISELIINKKNLSVNSIFATLAKSYPDSNNLGRMNDVLNKLKKAKLIAISGDKIQLLKRN